MSEPKGSRKGQELEKFKRRMIRSVARMMREKKPDQEIWEGMKKEIGSNCKTLWERMRMLTLKKLKRLLEAEDRVELISPVARMTLTDWLLFDLVIVHEKIDVIGREKLTCSYESNVLKNLFALVQRFEIESRSGENLAEAWTAATVYYNSKGHQCSPMMLQRRWYQIKELTRHKFYKFWFNYRGNVRQLDSAKQDSPGELQKSIALKYPGIITAKFLNWEERIEQRMVILPDELGVKMRQKNLMKPSDTSAPDIVLIEPQIEMIDLGANSDTDETPNDAIETNPPLIKIKSEPIDHVDHDVDVEYSIPPEKGSEFDAEIERLQMVEETFDDKTLITEPVTEPANPIVKEAKYVKDTEDCAKNLNDPDVVAFSVEDGHVVNIKRKDDVIIVDESPKKAVKTDSETDKTINDETLEESNINRTNESDVSETDSQLQTRDNPYASIAQISAVASAGIKVENVNDVIENVDETRDNLDETVIIPEMFPVISIISSAGIKVEKDLIVQVDTEDPDSDVTMISGKAINDSFEHEVSVTLPAISKVASEGIKLEMDIEPTEILSSQVNDTSTIQQTSTAHDDLISNVKENKLVDTIMEDVSEKNSLEEFGVLPADVNFEDGIEFADDGIAYIEDDEDDIISFGEPPLTQTATKENEDDPDTNEDDTANKSEIQKFDLKLLMCPVVYTTKLDAMTVFDDVSKYDHVYDKLSIHKIYTLSKPVSKQAITMPEEDDTNDTVNDDDLFINTSPVSESEVNEIERVKQTSYMLQKPKHRSYNPVLLCKNPDFNTRLKKLSVGFFMSARNRTLLQSCIPITIDMTKAFEDKLVNGTLYLKPTPVDKVISLKDDVEITSVALVKPSTVQQSCMNIDDTLETELKKRMAERVRAINLPDISQVRRLNQHLLTAEVTPLRLVESFNKQTPETSVKSVTENYIQNIKNDIDNLLSQPKTVHSSDFDNPVTAMNSLSVNISPIEVDVDLETKVQRSPSPTSVEVFTHQTINPNKITRPIVTMPIHSQTSMETIPTEVLKSKSQINSCGLAKTPLPQLTSETAQTKKTNIEEKNNSVNSTAKPKKIMRKTVYPKLAWNKRPLINEFKPNEPYEGDALLTIDTLYKMLTALDPTRIPDKQPIKKTDKKKQKDKFKMIQNNIEKPIDGSVEKTTIQSTVDVTIDITDDDVEQDAKKVKLKTFRAKGRPLSRYCCWSSFKIDKIKRNLNTRRKHRCDPDSCICCCKKKLFYEQNKTHLTPLESDHLISEKIDHVINKASVSNVVVVDASAQINLDEMESYEKPGPCVTIESSSVPIEIESCEESEQCGNTESSTEPIETEKHISYEKPGPCVTIECNRGPIEIESCEKSRQCVNTESSAEPFETINKPLDNAQNIPLDSTTGKISGVEERNETTITPNIPPSPKFRVYTGDSYKPIMMEISRSIVKKSKRKLSDKSSKFNSKQSTNQSSPSLSPKDKAPILLNYSDRRRALRAETKSIDTASCLACVSKISPVAIQGAIEINGGHTCEKFSKPIKKVESKVVFNKNLITDENQPFFVGKGKILLTNMRMPYENISVKEQNTSSKTEVEAIRLPAGVQIVLLPDQTLTYLIETNVRLTPEESAILPEFLIAIQQQINEGGITLPALNPAIVKDDEVIDLDKEPSTTITNAKELITDETVSAESAAPDIQENTNIDSEREADQVVNEKLQIDNTDDVTIENTNPKKEVLNTEKNIVSSPIKYNVTSAAESEDHKSHNTEDGAKENVSKETVTSGVADDTKDKVSKETVTSGVADDTDNKKSLLSDLMEMSGIMEEDLAPPPLVTQEPIIIDTQNFVLHRPVVRAENVISVPAIPVSSGLNSYTAVSNDGRFELSAVSSFTELKYACDNNGLFFKLDLETGNLSKINVSIQKFPSKPINKSIDSSDLIDLTDEPDTSITGITVDLQSKDDNPTTVPANKEIDKPPSKIQISTILQKKQRLMERLSNKLKPVNILQSKKHVARILKRNHSLLKDRQFMFYSKRKVNKIEAKINLEDSDAPMEEEYLDSGNSSDDEPLINKAKRMRLDEASVVPFVNQSSARTESSGTAQEPLPQDSIEKERPVLPHGKDKMASNTNNQPDKEEALLNNLTKPPNEIEKEQNQNDESEDIFDESDEEMADLSEPPVIEPVPTNLLLSGGAYSAHNIPLNQPYRADGEESQDEDCILGV